MTTATTIAGETRRQRDLRLDFFRGMAMFIILLAHTPGNSWTLWIPARFGFSDATEIFVFCSGMASGIAFGSVFLKRSWFLGTARIAFRVWQVYWAHIGVFLATALLMVLLDQTGMGEPGRAYAEWPSVVRFFTHSQETLVGLFTLTFIPGLFDILPMYLVILAMVPAVMAAYRAGGREAVFALVAVVWLASNLAGYARLMEGVEDASAIQRGVAWLGSHLTWLNLPGAPHWLNPENWSDAHTWFFNPFAWQLVFFTGFCFAMGWLPPPPVHRSLVITAIVVVLVTVPFAWFKIHAAVYMPDHWWLHDQIYNFRQWIEPLRWKTWIGAWRYLHFLSIAYLAYAAVGPGGVRLTEGWSVRQRSATERLRVRAVAGAVVLLTLPYALVAEIKWLLPAVDRWIFENWWLIPGQRIGMAQLVHLVALIVFLWHSIGDRARRWLVRDAFLAVVPVIRKVGTQSLAVFMVSIVLSRFNGWWMDTMDASIATSGWTYLTPRDVWVRALVNLTGFAVLIGTAYTVGWFKRQPWRERKGAPDRKHPSAADAAGRVAAE